MAQRSSMLATVGIAQHLQIDLAIALLGVEFGERRRDDGNRRHHQRVVMAGDRGDPADQIGAAAIQFDVFRRIHVLAAHDAHEHAGIVERALGLDQLRCQA